MNFQALNIHDPRVAIACMILGALIMAYALVRYRVFTQSAPAVELRKFAVVFGIGWILTLTGGLSAFGR